MTAQSIVRLANPDDEEGIMALCRMLHEENGLFPLDDDMVRDTIRKAFNKQGFIGVIGAKDALEGIIYMVISNFWYSKKPHLEELFNYVHPDHRKSEHAKSLIEFAKKCATNDIRLVIGVISNTRTEAKIRLYERRLGKPAGAFFVYPPPAAALIESH